MAATCVFRSGQRCMDTIKRFYRRNPMIGSDCGDQGYLKKPMAAVANYQPKSCCNPFATNSWSLFGATAGGRQCVRGFSTSTTSSMPLLMIPPETKWIIGDDQHKDKDKSYHHFYNVRRQVVTRARKRQIPGLPDDTPWTGSCHGWVIFMNKTNGSPYLVNPFHDYPCPVKPLSDYKGVFPHYVQLPPLDPLNYDIYIKKLAMSGAPYDDNCKMMAVIGPSGDLAFCRPGDKKWTPLKGLLKDDSYKYNDVIYSSRDQLFYAIGGESTDHNYFESWDLLNGSAHPEGTLIRPSLFHPYQDAYVPDRDFMEANSVQRRYLVQLLGDLFLISRLVVTKVDEEGTLIFPAVFHQFPDYTEEEERERYTYMTFSFDRFKLDWVQNKWEYQSHDSFGDHSVFLGLNHSFSHSNRDCPHDQEGNGDVYFTDDSLEKMNTSHFWGGHDCGINANPRCFFPPTLKRIQPPPIWVDNVPSLSE